MSFKKKKSLITYLQDSYCQFLKIKHKLSKHGNKDKNKGLSQFMIVIGVWWGNVIERCT